MSKSEYAITGNLRWVTGTTGIFGSTGVRWVHLWTVSPAADGTGGTAVTGGGYVPIEVGGSSGAFPAISAGVTSVSNDTIITHHAAATAAWGTVVAFTIHATSSTSSNMLRVEPLDNAVTISSGPSVSWPVGSLVIRES